MPSIITRGAMSARGFGFGYKAAGVAAGSQSYTTPGTYTWVAPAGVTSVSVVAIGGGGKSASVYSTQGGGGALGYKNNYSVTPGTSYTVVVGSGAYAGSCTAGDSYFVNTSTVKGGAGRSYCRTVATFVGDGGGNGGLGGCTCVCTCITGGGGGAGGYSGAGGNGFRGVFSTPGTCGSGGGGAGGNQGGSGGGVGISGGQGSNGSYPRGGGSGGTSGSGINGGSYGGGGAGGSSSAGGAGAVRLVWPGATRQFPSTCVGSP